MAPTGSITIPSHLAIVPTRPVGRMCRSKGPTTVGPVTTSIVPRMMETARPVRRKRWAAAAVSTAVTRAPIVHRLRITAPDSCSSPNRSVSPPSKRIKATARETRANKKSAARNWSGFRNPVTGPATNPTTNSSRMDGIRSRQASHWEPMPSTTTVARVRRVAGFAAATRYQPKRSMRVVTLFQGRGSCPSTRWRRPDQVHHVLPFPGGQYQTGFRPLSAGGLAADQPVCRRGPGESTRKFLL